MKKLFVPIVLLLMIAFYWRATSQRETGTSTISSWKPVTQPATAQPPIERETSSTSPARPVAARDARAVANAALERKRRVNGADNASPAFSPMEAFKDLPKTEVQTVNDRPFHVLGATAVPRDRYTGSMGKLLREENGFAIVEMKDADPAWEKATFRSDARPVLLNPNGRLAVVTGGLLVKVRDLASVDEIAAGEKLEVVSKDGDTRTAFLKVPDGYALLEGQKRLQSDARIERVELELYQSRKERK